jgi:hypothetical protein
MFFSGIFGGFQTPTSVPTNTGSSPAQTQIQQASRGIAPTAQQNAQCESRYGQSVSAKAQQYLQPDATTSVANYGVGEALFFSPSLNICVGVIEVQNFSSVTKGNESNVYMFNAANGQTLSASDHTTASADWNAKSASSTAKQ